MAIANYDAYVADLNLNEAAIFNMAGTLSFRAGRLCRPWAFFTPTPATPTTSVALNKSSLEALQPLPPVGAGRLTMLGGRFGSSAPTASCAVMIDILNISGGLSGIVTGAQTTNLPTAALTRYTSGEGVMAALVIHTSIGATGTTFTVQYTNSSGTSGRVSTAAAIGTSSFNSLGSVLPIPLQAGDTGVRSVESVTLAGTTGTAGNVGVFLYKPLSMISLDGSIGASVIDAVSSGGFIGSLAEIDPNACLSFLLNQASASQQLSGSVFLAEV